ncbi:MAG: endonuclease/exonuclease/phosphatase family protein [Acidobacteria bacterium]|nr:endonuclease/exonuclease/phosphatase family protein [Acidobacteriota bacterium]
MRPLHLPIVIALSVLGCDTGTPAAPTPVVSDNADTTPPGTTTPAPATPPGPTVARPAFKVMTYNVQLANFGAPNPASRKPMIVEIIRSEAPDIVGLQELGSTHRADIEAGLQDLYDFFDGGSGRNAELILLRKNVLAGSGQGMVTLSTQCGGSLGVTFLEVRSLRGVDFVLFNTHLCFTNPAQHAIQVIDTLADRYPGRQAVVLGDLNSRQGGDTMNFFLEQGELLGRVSPVRLYDTWALAGGDRSSRVGTGIDWILTTDGTGQAIAVTDASVVANASQASDHIPITATLF